MVEPAFDPSGFYSFLLDRGRVETRGGIRVVMLSDTAVAPLVATAVRNGDLTAVRRLGKQLGELVAISLGGRALELSAEAVLSHMSSVVSLFGWGRLELERWGDALVAALTEAPEVDDDNLGTAALLGGAFSVVAAREVACVPVSEGRFLVVDPAVAEEVWLWSKENHGLGTIVDRLHLPEGS